MRRFLVLSVVILFMVSGCRPKQVPGSDAEAPVPAPTSLPASMQEAHDVLVDYLTLLHTGKYAEAVPLYDGEYESLQVFNPQVDPADKAALWAWACDNRLLQCLEVRSVKFKTLAGDSYIFQVEFSNPDGSLFVRGPCCGSTETEMPSVSQFEFTVSRDADHRYVVMTTPPYVP